MGLHQVPWPRSWPVLALAAPVFVCFAQPPPGDFYVGMIEVSAAVALDERHFAVAEDECNTLLIYARGQAKPVGKATDLAKFLKTGDKASDTEGGASVSDHYLMVAGPVGDTGTFALFFWSGSPQAVPALQFEPHSRFYPEALVPIADSKNVDLLSDDGSTQSSSASGSAAKTQQTFRTL